jgi:hypothetical protein
MLNQALSWPEMISNKSANDSLAILQIIKEYSETPLAPRFSK